MGRDLKFLVVLAFYQRYKMVLNALESLRDQEYQGFHLAFVDDGSEKPGAPIAKEVLGITGEPRKGWMRHKESVEFYDRATFYRIEDSPEDKVKQQGSRHPEFMNRAITDWDGGPEDIVLILCDDDGYFPDYLDKLNDYYKTHPEVVYSFTHLAPFNPYTEPMSLDQANRPFWLNHNKDVWPYSAIDGSQFSVRKKAFLDGIKYPSPAWRCLDAHLFGSLQEKYGICVYNGLGSKVWKGDFEDQLGKRNSGNEHTPTDGRFEG